MSDFFYCIIHDEWTWMGESYDPNQCVLTSCPPPPVPDDWELTATPPSADEMEIMDRSAYELLSQVV